MQIRRVPRKARTTMNRSYCKLNFIAKVFFFFLLISIVFLVNIKQNQTCISFICYCYFLFFLVKNSLIKTVRFFLVYIFHCFNMHVRLAKMSKQENNIFFKHKIRLYLTMFYRSYQR